MATSYPEPPQSAAWLHREARQGFEVAFFAPDGQGLVVHGQTASVEAGEARRTPSSAAVEAPVCWAVGYSIRLDPGWRTRDARVRATTAGGDRETRIECAGGRWSVDGAERPELDGCLDLDLESSALTNAFPVRRLGLGVGERAEAPAAYVRALDLSVGRLEQSYERLAGDGPGFRYAYVSPAFGFAAELAYDRFGLAADYPGIAVRAA